MKVSVGKVAVKPFPPMEEEDGIRLSDAKRAIRGRVVALGAPQTEMFTRWEMLLWTLFRIHPCPFKPGSIILMPKFPREFDGVVYFWQSDIDVYDLEE